jgi:FlaG/FlaF family flagellin (archaellin)
MKGVSDVIAEVLILMIVTALAALAWTWLSGIFSILTATAETSVMQTVTGMAQNFVLENAWCELTTPELQFTIRNTGTNPIDDDVVAAYVNAQRKDVTPPGTDISPEEDGDFTSSYDCTGDIGETLTITIQTGLSKTRRIE